MRVSCRDWIVVTFVAVLSTGCQRATPAPPAQTGGQQQRIIERLDRIETDLLVLDRLDRVAMALQQVERSAAAFSAVARSGQELAPGLGAAPSTARSGDLTTFAPRLPSESATPPTVPGTPAATAATAAKPSTASKPGVAGAVAQLAYAVIAVTDGGTITGKVVFEGAPRPPKVFKVEKTPEVCGAEDRLLAEVAANNGYLQDVVLALDGVKGGKPFSSHVLLGPPPGAREATGSSEAYPGTDVKPKKCLFGSFTGVIADGSVLRFDNQDPVKHSPHTYEVVGMVRKSLHNQDLEGNGKLELQVKFKKSRVLKLECDQHAHMQNWFFRVSNPYYAFSGSDGTFQIDQVPPGTYKLLAWHPILGEQSQDVTVAANGNTNVTFKFSDRAGGIAAR